MIKLSVHLLCDCPHLVDPVGDMRWKEWGHAPEPEDREWWIDVTAQEAGRSELPVTWVACDGSGNALGAVGLNEYDIEERTDRSPWVIGTIVDAPSRGLGVGAALMNELESWARDRAYTEIWVATERAEAFYRKCGWNTVEVVDRPGRESVVVLRKDLLDATDDPREGVVEAHGG